MALYYLQLERRLETKQRENHQCLNFTPACPIFIQQSLLQKTLVVMKEDKNLF